MCLRLLTSQNSLFLGVEKKNDDFRRFFHRKINRWEACKSLLLVEKRQEALRCYKREPRHYQKRDTQFWFEGGKRNAINQHRSAAALPPPVIQPVAAPNSTEITYSEQELRKKKVGELKVIAEDLLGYQLGSKPLKKDLITQILSFNME